MTRVGITSRLAEIEPIIRRLASRYSDRGIEFDDFAQELRIHALRAIELYNANANHRSIPWIRFAYTMRELGIAKAIRELEAAIK